MEDRWVREFEVDGELFEAVFVRRPFREGFEVYVEVDGEQVSVPELGLGEQALIERATSLVRSTRRQKA